jgi:hypothetical protein
MQTAKWPTRIGAAFYVLWGIFHLAAANAVYALAEQSTGMVRARLLQDAFYLLFFALAGILIAAILNWRNDKQGYWMNGMRCTVSVVARFTRALQSCLARRPRPVIRASRTTA